METEHPMMEKGWAVVFDMPSFDAARNKITRPSSGYRWWLHRTLAGAHKYAADLASDTDTHPARVFWVVRET